MDTPWTAPRQAPWTAPWAAPLMDGTMDSTMDSSTWFSLTESRGGAANTRSTQNSLGIQRPNTIHMKEPRLYFWGTRSVDVWNSLPENTRLAPSVNLFKESYDSWICGLNET